MEKGLSASALPAYMLVGHKLLVDDHHYATLGCVQSATSWQCHLGPREGNMDLGKP